MKLMSSENQSSANFAEFSEFLIGRGVMTPLEARHVRGLALEWGSDFLPAYIATETKTSIELAKLISEFYQLPFLDLSDLSIDENLLINKGEDYLAQKAIPVGRFEGITKIACQRPDQGVLCWAMARYGKNFSLCISSSAQINAVINQKFGKEFSHRACEKLFEKSSVDSAKITFTFAQTFLLILTPLVVVASFISFYQMTLMMVCILMNAYYLFTLVFRSVLTFVGDLPAAQTEVSDADLAGLDFSQLPHYTILVPVLREASILPVLVEHLRLLKYPRSKLQIKILLEEDDRETREVAESLHLENYFELLVVPPSYPKTKPKALNYGLPFVKGEFVTIYDAEDRPEPDQLLKALVVFNRLGNVSCVQARLNYFNPEENYFTRMFTLEYSQWFDYFLTGLYRLKIPIPLGGTSNHFRTSVLNELGGWDPYNVTEDADLGIRLEKNGHRVAVMNSTTWEEANTQLGNWIRQRSRWMKGHMQTFLVHTRNPLELYRQIGPVGFFGFCFFVRRHFSWH